MPSARVVHCKSGQRYDRYIGRSSYGDNGRYGNPWEIGIHGTREEVIAAYEGWLRTGESSGNALATSKRRAEILEHLEELRGKVLGCWCEPPLVCHGHVLIRLLDDELNPHRPSIEAVQGG